MYAPNAPVPSSGEIAMPVTVESVVAMLATGERFVAAGLISSVAASSGAKIDATARANTADGAKRFMAAK